MGIVSMNLAGLAADAAVRAGARRLAVRNACVAISSLGPTPMAPRDSGPQKLFLGRMFIVYCSLYKIPWGPGPRARAGPIACLLYIMRADPGQPHRVLAAILVCHFCAGVNAAGSDSLLAIRIVPVSGAQKP
jgi:hypothetical protein